jgi:hypothetical protein
MAYSLMAEEMMFSGTDTPDLEGDDPLESVDPQAEKDPDSPMNEPITVREVSSEPEAEESQPVVLPESSPGEKILQPIVPPLRSDSTEDIHMITVILRPCEDKVRDKLLLRRIFGIMISHPGEDRFAFHIFERGRGHLLEFPNLTTGICQDLMAQLHDLVGSDSVRIEPITFQ